MESKNQNTHHSTIENDNKNCKQELSAYKKFLLCKNQSYERYKQKYFDYYDDVKDKTHRIYDW